MARVLSIGISHLRAVAVALALMIGACSAARLQEPGPVAEAPLDAGVLQPSAAGGFPPSPSGSITIMIPTPYLGAPCDRTRTVAPQSSALIVRDPAVLARFPLERVLRQITTTGRSTVTPLELLQRVFDTQNASGSAVFADNPHCDMLRDDEAIAADPWDCPRAEGQLARSSRLLDANHADGFVPVAIVNRFDLLPKSLETCGEYRLMYAKQSGRSNPGERVLLTLEAALPNLPAARDGIAQDIAACRPIAELWAGLPGASSDVVAERLERFFFEGSDGFAPVVHADHYGLRFSDDCDYTARCGQLRVAQGMQAPWQFRQFRLRSPMPSAFPRPTVPGPTALFFAPTPDTSSPRPELFDPLVMDPHGPDFRSAFVFEHVATLSESEIPRMRLLSLPLDEGIESAIEGPAQPSYSRAIGAAWWPELEGQIAAELAKPELTQHTSTCPPGDPLTPTSMLRRATAVTCAGCHAPDRLLAPDRALGCGVTQPNSLGTTHIDEQGTFSEALTQVFLPHRAAVLSTYLQACDYKAVERNLQPIVGRLNPECFIAGTPITLADGSEKPIEQIGPGEQVLAFDPATRALVPALVRRNVMRPDADRLVVINDGLVATANHPFHTPYGLTRADALRLGDTLYELREASSGLASDLQLTARAVERLALRPGSIQTYNLEVANHHNYFAAGVLVHDRP